jgi:DNA-binding NarL/FixJ family response regulator
MNRPLPDPDQPQDLPAPPDLPGLVGLIRSAVAHAQPDADPATLDAATREVLTDVYGTLASIGVARAPMGDTGPIRLAVIDDHRAISKGVPEGLAPLVNLAAPVVHVLTVNELLVESGEFDVVVLDVWLADNSEPQDNVRRLRARGWNVVMYTQEPRPAVLGRCLQAGANGLVGKHEEWTVLAEAVELAASGEVFMNVDWAAAIEALTLDSVPDLSPREREVIGLYAAGLPLKSVARRLAISEETAREHLRRVRRKYQAVGRPADTKTDLYRRAVEDGHLPAPDGR